MRTRVFLRLPPSRFALRRTSLRPALLLSIALVSGCSRPEPPAPPAGPLEDQITTESLTAHVKTIGSDEFEGRAPATPGGEKTQNYLAEQLKTLGVAPGAADGSYFQQVPIVESVVDRNFVL